MFDPLRDFVWWLAIRAVQRALRFFRGAQRRLVGTTLIGIPRGASVRVDLE